MIASPGDDPRGRASTSTCSKARTITTARRAPSQALALALRQAVARDGTGSIPSTKGVL
ncbi:MAG: hypothetical protein R3B70_15370 [Polyangiaceae bacterium]